MRFYTCQHRFTCGVDLHTKNAYLCILDEQGQVVYHRNIRARPEDFLKAIEPYRDDLVVGCECMFMWYWLADLCAEQEIEFVLGHALYMKAIHGAKAANDRLDSLRIAKLLKGGTFPLAYVYPSEWRSSRDLLRRRTKLVRLRAHLLAHLRCTHWQYQLEPPGTRTAARRNRVDFEKRFDDPSTRMSVEADLAVIDTLEQTINRLELFITKEAKVSDAFSFHLLRSVPGIGKILSLTMLYEIHDIKRFDRHQQFASYARLVRCEHTSAGKRKGFGGRKIGNAHLKWAFSEAAVLMLPKCPQVKKLYQRWEARHGTKQALSRLAHKIARAVFYILKQQRPFDLEVFLQTA